MKTEDISRLIVEFYERLTAWEAAVVKGSGLTTSQNHTIEIIGYAGSIPMKDLAAKIGVTTGTLTTSIDRLEEKKLLRRVPHPQDRRSTLIELTEAGQAVFRKHAEAHLDLTADLLDSFGDEEKAQLHAHLKKLRDAIPAP